MTVGSTEVAIVATAYENWGTNCFANSSGMGALNLESWLPLTGLGETPDRYSPSLLLFRQQSD